MGWFFFALLRDGSIKCDYKAKFSGTINSTTVSEEIKTRTNSLNSANITLNGTNVGMTINIEKMRQAVTEGNFTKYFTMQSSPLSERFF